MITYVKPFTRVLDSRFDMMLATEDLTEATRFGERQSLGNGGYRVKPKRVEY